MNRWKFIELCGEYFMDPGIALENEDLVKLLNTNPTEDAVSSFMAENF